MKTIQLTFFHPLVYILEKERGREREREREIPTLRARERDQARLSFAQSSFHSETVLSVSAKCAFDHPFIIALDNSIDHQRDLRECPRSSVVLKLSPLFRALFRAAECARLNPNSPLERAFESVSLPRFIGREIHSSRVSSWPRTGLFGDFPRIIPSQSRLQTLHAFFT